MCKVVFASRGGLSHFASFIRSTKVRLMSLFLHQMAVLFIPPSPQVSQMVFSLGRDERNKESLLKFFFLRFRRFKIKLILVDYRRDVLLAIISPGVPFPTLLPLRGGGNFFVALNISMHSSKSVDGTKCCKIWNCIKLSSLLGSTMVFYCFI